MSDVFKSLTAGLNIFYSYDDWKIFIGRLNDALLKGEIRKIPVLKSVYTPSEQWFVDPQTDETYVYVVPDERGPKWKKFDVLAHLEGKAPAPLSILPLGKISPLTAHMMKQTIESLVSRGLVKELPCPVVQTLRKHETERRFRDMESNIVYRLMEYYGLREPDDIRWEVVPQAEINPKIQ
jgi:hypothetical protein